MLRIDLRDYQWDANLWNRLLAEYPYGVLNDTAVARAVVVGTATRVPCIRADWFLANASRAPLYYDLLQIPSNLSELERQLHVDVAVDMQQERVMRAGFLGSGISRNNRLIERHDAMNGAYWRTYDFEAIPQNLVNRDLLLPDRRNLFAYPLGPGFQRQHLSTRRRRSHLQLAQRSARLFARQRQRRPPEQGQQRHRQRSETARSGGGGRRVVHVVPRRRHQSQGRSNPRSRRQEREVL